MSRAGVGGPKVRLDPDASLDLRWLGSDRGERVIRFIQRFCRLTKGAWAGQLVRLRPFQKEIVRGVFAPRVRQAYVSMAWKNGKSFLAAAMGLYALCGDGEQGAEVYAVAGDERQARVASESCLALLVARVYGRPGREACGRRATGAGEATVGFARWWRRMRVREWRWRQRRR